jgi:hypothetical protein
MSQGNTYSFKALTGVLTNPVFGVTLPLTGGNIGAGKFTIEMSTERTVQDIAADGTVMPSYISANNGTLAVEVQESSVLHSDLLDLYNQAILAAESDDVEGWAAMVVSFRMMTDGSQHTLSGVSFSKVPGKPYESAGQKITWMLQACDVQNS